MEWEYLCDYLHRLKVPGGWIVKHIEDVMTNVSQDTIEHGYEFRSSICFVPDPDHTWEIIDEE